MTGGQPGLALDVEYALDPERTSLGFRAKAWGLLWVSGTLRLRSGSVTIAEDRLQAHGVADATSVDTGLRPRDWHLRTGHYLHSGRHPAIELSAETDRHSSRQLQARLTVRGTVTPVSLTVEDLTRDRDIVRIHARGAVDRRAFGMLPPVLGVSRIIELQLEIVGNRSPSADALSSTGPKAA
jgi:polyisoprenoid-binding protein YceI